MIKFIIALALISGFVGFLPCPEVITKKTMIYETKRD